MLGVVRIGQSYDVKIAPDERSVVALTNTQVVAWDLRTGEVAASKELHDGAYADFSPDGSLIAVVDTGGECRVFGAEDLHEVARLTGEGLGEGPDVLFGPDGDVLVQASWAGDLVVRSLPGGEAVHEEREPGRMIEALAHSPDRMLFAYASAVRGESEVSIRVRRWPFEQSRPEELLRLTDRHPSVDALAVDAQGRVAIRERTRLSVFDPAGSRLASRDLQLSGLDGSVAWSVRGDLAATDRGPDGQHGVTVMTHELDEQWTTALPYACAVDFSNSGALLAVGSWDAGAVLRVE
jgi:WD40 repeat protein